MEFQPFRSKKIVVALGLAVVAIAMTMAIGLDLGGATPAPAAGGSSHLAILDRPMRADDALSSIVLSSPGLAKQLDTRSQDARLALVAGADRLYVVPGSIDGTICLVDVNEGDASVVSNCAPGATLDKGVIYLSTPHQDGTIDVVGVVGDQFHTIAASDGASSTRVSNNAFAISRLQGQHLVLDGSVDVDLGPQFPVVVKTAG